MLQSSGDSEICDLMTNDMFNGNDDNDNQKEKNFPEETISNEQLIFFNKTTNL